MLLPLLVYLIILLGNYDVLTQSYQINIFWISQLEFPFLLFTIIFFSLYCMILWGIFRFSGLFSLYQSHKQGQTIDALKAELHDKQPQLIADIENKFQDILAKMNDQHQKDITTLKRENDKILSRLDVEVKTLKEKIKDFSNNITS